MISSLHIDTVARAIVLRFAMAAFVAAALLIPRIAHADESSCTTPSPQVISQMFDNWNSAVAAGSADELANFYADDATLIPAKASEPLVGKDAIRNFYAGLLARHPQPVVVKMSVTPGCNSAVASGFILYRVTGVRKGTRDLLGGQFTAEFALQNGNWRIVKHTLGGDARKLDQPLESSML
ncbi:MAG: SgcJ/EcaC family oxidoreductase [Proteobacteria bacterium]|nr:SgcJ/EcaC family oxidoreductase [Pseudomonadota bacterium]